MRIKALLFVAVFFAAISNVFAVNHLVEVNSPSTITLHDGDEITLSKLPTEWGFSRIALGINSASQNKLSGQIAVKNCFYTLDDNYKLVDFSYENDASAKYYGPTQSVLIQGWVDAAPVVAQCEYGEQNANEHSSRIDEKNKMDFRFAVNTAKFVDLGPIESVTEFKGPSGHFKITSLPKWNFNRVYIQVEPTDGRALNGYLYANDQQSKLSGMSINVPMNLKTDAPVTFELAFVEFRKVKLKWWAVMESPRTEPAKLVEKSIGKDSVIASYTFENSVHRNHNVDLKFRKSDFVDAKLPEVKRYEFNPDGVLKIDSLNLNEKIGNIYNIHAELKNAQMITFALPLDFNYNPDIDTVTMMHQVGDKWVEVPVDSVKNGFVYFRTNSFSNWFEKLGNALEDAFTTYACNLAPASYLVSETCRDAAGNVVRGTATTLKHFYDKVKELGVNAICLDADGFGRLFGFDDDDDDDEWSGVDAGTLNFNSIDPNVDPKYKDVLQVLLAKKFSTPIKLSDGKSNGICGADDIDEVCEWKVTKYNLDILLADAIMSQREGNTRRFSGISYKDDKFILSADAVVKYTDLWGGYVEKPVYYTNGMMIDLQTIPTVVPPMNYNYKDYFKISSGFVESAPWFIKGLEHCLNMVNFEGIVVQKWIDFAHSLDKNYTAACRNFLEAIDYAEISNGQIENTIDCAEFVGQNIGRDYSMMSDHEAKLIAVSEAMARVSLLAWLDKTLFRDFIRLHYQKTYDGVHEWLKLADPFFMKNNIVAKARASLSLYEYIFSGGLTNFNLLNESLKLHYGQNGGYSEGAGYSLYIWEDVPYVLSALIDAASSTGNNLKIEEKFLKSPDYMFDFSRPVGKDGVNYGLIPVEVDDGCTYNPDYRVWAKLKNDSKYLAMANYAPLQDEGKKTALLPFGFPATNVYKSIRDVPNRGKLWGNNQDGILMITAVRGDGRNADTVALSMIAEDDDLWKNGQAHDQQDNLSITLSSNKKGFIIQDRGYSGFGNRKNENFHRYWSHNVLIPRDASQHNNEVISELEVRDRVQKFTGNFSGVTQSILASLFNIIYSRLEFGNSNPYSMTLHGGNNASVEEHFIDKPGNGIVGYTASTLLELPVSLSSSSSTSSSSSATTVLNHRSILYFGDNFWVIDRPKLFDGTDVGDLKFIFNTPIEWDDLPIQIYGSSVNKVSSATKTPLTIYQNDNRKDYVGNYLSINAYTVYDEKAKTMVMKYANGGESFQKVVDQCPKSCQCFENTTKTKRLVVPPLNEKFELCDALPLNECTDHGKSSGVTMFVKSLEDGWNTGDDLILDGHLTVEEKGIEIEIKSVIVSRMAFVYERSDGSAVSKWHRSNYLPANKILLRQ